MIVSIRPDRTVAAFKECLDRGFVHIKFTETQGGTELGIPVDVGRSDLSKIDWDSQTGSATIVGAISLDYVKVECIARVELPSLECAGRLAPVSTDA